MREEQGGTGRGAEAELERLRRRVRELEAAACDREDKAARLESLMRAAPLAIGLVSGDRVLLEVNDYLCRMLGYSREELVGKSALILYPSREDFDFVGREKYAQIEERGVGSVETRWKRRDGEVLHVLLSSVRVDPSDPSAGTVFTALDISESKRAQEALRESEEKYRLIVETAQEGIWAIDKDAVTTFVNPRMAEMLGYAVEDMLGKILFCFMDEEARPRAEEHFERRRKGINETHDFEFRGKDGVRVITNFRTSPLTDKEGGFMGAIAFVTDITESKRAQERREKLNQVFMRLGPDILDNIEGILRGAEEILACRLAIYCLLVGERLSILTTAPGEEGFTVTTDKESYLCYAFISGGAKSPQVVPDLAGRPGIAGDKLAEKYGLASFILYPVVVEGRTVGCLGCFDSRPREWTEEEVELAGMLAQAVSVEQERLDREEDLKEFIDVASHELRHPITVIKGYAQTLRELWGKLPSGKRWELLEAVEHGADRLERLVKELLDLSRIERGYFPLRREEVPVEPLLYAAAAELSNRGYLHVVNVVSRVGEDKVIADGDRLSLLLSILLDNAAKYSPQGSDIDLMIEEGDAGLLFSVMDRGIGVPEGERERIFERFYQVEDVLHHSFPGMGIGLYIARDIVEAHGGRIWCEAREGGGTIFRFTIPQGGREEEERWRE